MVAVMEEKRLRFGVHAPPEGKNFREMRELCQAAENLGYDLFTVTDHFMNMANPAGPENHPLECWTTLAGLATVTSKIDLGPLVCCVNFRHPTVLAKMATTVDIISGGRLFFGVGAGAVFGGTEFEGFMGRYPSARERLDGLEDAIQICRSMFTKELTNFSGKLYSAKNTLNSPRPIQESIPIIVGGSGEKRTLKIAAKYADISHLFSNSPQELKHKLEVLRMHCQNVKQDYRDISIATGFRPIMDPTTEEIKTRTEWMSNRAKISLSEAEKLVRLTVGAKNILSTLAEYQRLGVTLVTLNSLGIEEMKSFKEEVISKLRQ
ncbi:MAG: LLM class flavin-dependent oxidoreductase [archaeon]